MIVYFEDGKLLTSNGVTPLDIAIPSFAVIIDAAEGVSRCKQLLDYFSESIVYTNSPLAFDNKYVWYKELEVPEIRLRDRKNEWKRIDELTDRELQEGHNLWKLYLAGEFNGK